MVNLEGLELNSFEEVSSEEFITINGGGWGTSLIDPELVEQLASPSFHKALKDIWNKIWN
ncbi:hypothetical protein POG14_00805 [Clostridium paraputrificum]|uniref:hypothetical protein n=1 Tax=Clostridium paraputrificum TaxID=29363 RepID=UPI00189BBF98|nr:hypothetical protein [Clostridium paraputrificum]MDC0800706.1 hypothetical protein [Clostridium paraputrificum]